MKKITFTNIIFLYCYYHNIAYNAQKVDTLFQMFHQMDTETSVDADSAFDNQCNLIKELLKLY